MDRVNHIGDWGTQFGMLIRHLKNVFPDFATKPPPIADLTQFYKESKKVFDEDEVFAKQAHEEVVALQAGDGQSRYAWGQICDVSRKEFEKVYSRLGVKLTEKGESYYNEYIPAVVAHLEEIGLAKEVSRAAGVFDPLLIARRAASLTLPFRAASDWLSLSLPSSCILPILRTAVPSSSSPWHQAREPTHRCQVGRRLRLRLDRHGRYLVPRRRAARRLGHVRD